MFDILRVNDARFIAMQKQVKLPLLDLTAMPAHTFVACWSLLTVMNNKLHGQWWYFFPVIFMLAKKVFNSDYLSLQVVTFEDMIASGEGIDHLRKPVFCPIHVVETIKFFCCSCLVSDTCNQALPFTSFIVIIFSCFFLKVKDIIDKDEAKLCRQAAGQIE